MADSVEEHFQRIPYRPATDGKVEIHSGLSRHYPTLHGNLVTPPRYTGDIAVLMAHPASNFLSHFLVRAFAEAGIPIMAMNTRYAANEAALLMERAAEDLGAGVRWLREHHGFERVVLLGDGKVVADGTHEDLLATEPRYRSVLAAWARAEEDGDADRGGVDGDRNVGGVDEDVDGVAGYGGAGDGIDDVEGIEGIEGALR